ncbi:MAPEG family protein [Rhizobium lemnae]|uniref:MAPEG family protein n=1 Tax=Rhizobium lemnae TaxID=1214924 RepID=A0ABV8E9R3_9HYPH|nr:MAPEG family protein [Rhizobium lemnae]MCJ8506496.1 MAPEG family protein [Rhizobium lemnae]
MISDQSMIWPMFAHVVLVFVLYVLLSRRRVAAVKGGRATVAQFRQNLSEPEDSLFVHNNLKNQFELPIFFHVACIAIYIVNADNIGTVLLAWLFVISRYVHSYIHISTNHIAHRRPAFIVGFGALLIMWIWLAIWMVLT